MRRRREGWLLGVALIAVGTLLLIDRTSGLGLGDIISKWWPAILIVVGGWWLYESKGRNAAGLALLLVGIGLLAGNLNILPPRREKYVWPVVLIAVGVWLLAIRSGRLSRR